MSDSINTAFAYSAVFNIVLSFIGIIFCWKLFDNFSSNIEKFIEIRNLTNYKLIIMVLSIICGHSLAKFVLDFLSWSKLLSNLF